MSICALCRLVNLVLVEVETVKVGKWTSRHVLKWRKQNGKLIGVGEDLYAGFNVEFAEKYLLVIVYAECAFLLEVRMLGLIDATTFYIDLGVLAGIIKKKVVQVLIRRVRNHSLVVKQLSRKGKLKW